MDRKQQLSKAPAKTACYVCRRPAITVERCGKVLCAEHAALLRRMTSKALDQHLQKAS